MEMFLVMDVVFMKQTVTNSDLSELRYSIGLGVTWITALGPLSFALASVFNDSPTDRTETFQLKLVHNFKKK